jgi:hypothetical protein
MGVILRNMSASAGSARVNLSGSLYLDHGTAAGAGGGGFIVMPEVASVGNPAANTGSLYVADNSGTTTIYFKDSAGTETSLIAGGSGTPGGSDTQIQYNNSDAFAGSSGNTLNATVFTKLTTDASADILLESSYNSATAIKLLTNADVAEQIVITNTLGTNAAAIDINALAGGVTVDAGGAISLDAAAASNLSVSAGGLAISSTGDAASFTVAADAAAEDLTVQVTGAVDASVHVKSSGTGNDAISLAATAGGVSVATSASGKSVYIAASGGSTQEVDISSAGTAASAIDISASAGGIDIDAGTTIDLLSTTTTTLLATTTMSVKGTTGASFGDDTGTWEFDGAGAVTETGMTSLEATPSGAITLTAGAASVWSSSAGDLTVDSAAGSLNLTGGEADAAAVKIEADNAAGGIDVDAGTGGIAIDTTGVLSIDSAGGASNVSHTATADGDFTIAMDSAVDASLILSSTGTEADALQITASAGGIDISATGGAGEDIDIDATTSSVNITGSEAQRDAVKILSDTSAGGIQLQVADADGVAIMGNVTGDTFVKVTANATAGSEIIAIVNGDGTTSGIGNTGAIQIVAQSGGVTIEGADDCAAAIGTSDLYLAVMPNSTAASDTIALVNSAGTSAAAFGATTTLGGMTFTTNASKDIVISTNAVVPTTDITGDLGSSSKRWANLYTGDLHLSNDRGNWTLVEENDMVTFRNNKTGRWFRMLMEEIDPTDRDHGMKGAPPRAGDSDVEWDI